MSFCLRCCNNTPEESTNEEPVQAHARTSRREHSPVALPVVLEEPTDEENEREEHNQEKGDQEAESLNEKGEETGENTDTNKDEESSGAQSDETLRADKLSGYHEMIKRLKEGDNDSQRLVDFMETVNQLLKDIYNKQVNYRAGQGLCEELMKLFEKIEETVVIYEEVETAECFASTREEIASKCSKANVTTLSDLELFGMVNIDTAELKCLLSQYEMLCVFSWWCTSKSDGDLGDSSEELHAELMKLFDRYYSHIRSLSQ